MRTLLAVLVAILCAGPCWAYSKPQGVPTLDLTPAGYSLTIGVWAVHTLVGDGLGIFEYRPASQDWALCGNCITTPDTPNMDASVTANGPLGYVIIHKAELNSLLAARYPAIGGTPVSGVDKVNQFLAGQTLQMVNGLPVLP